MAPKAKSKPVEEPVPAVVPGETPVASVPPVDDTKKKKGDKKNRHPKLQGFKIYIRKVLKQVHPEVGISNKAMCVMDAFVSDVFTRIANEASVAARHGKKATLTSRDIQTAVRLLIPGDLGQHAVSTGTKAVTTYTTSKA